MMVDHRFRRQMQNQILSTGDVPAPPQGLRRLGWTFEAG